MVDLVTDYSARLCGDAQWANDWCSGDSEHSRMENRWVDLAYARGAARHFRLDYWSELADTLDGTAGGGDNLLAAASTGASRAAGRGPNGGISKLDGVKQAGVQF